MSRLFAEFLLQSWPLLFVAGTGTILALLHFSRYRRVATMLLLAMALCVAHLFYLPMVYGFHRGTTSGAAAIPHWPFHELMSQLMFVAAMVLMIGAIFAERRDPNSAGFDVGRPH